MRVPKISLTEEGEWWATDHGGQGPRAGIITNDIVMEYIGNLEAENENLSNEREAILHEAKCWAMEAKTQRNTVNEVGSALGGVPDWGPIAKGVRENLERLGDLEARVAPLDSDEAEFCLDSKSGDIMSQPFDGVEIRWNGSQLVDRLNWYHEARVWTDERLFDVAEAFGLEDVIGEEWPAFFEALKAKGDQG